MKKAVLGALAAVLCCVLALGIFPRRAAAVDFYFMSVNDTLLELNTATMPTYHRGMIYVPYYMLNPSMAKVNLGVYAIYSAANNQAMVYASNRMLVFDIESNTTYDENGVLYDQRAFVRNSMVYLPLSRVCAHFPELRYSVNATPQGTLVRVCNSSVVLSDATFIKEAAGLMEAYIARNTATPPPTPTPTPTPSAAPQPTVSPSPSPGPDTPDGGGAGVYPGFDMDGAADPARLLEALERQEAVGLFFFAPEELAQRDDLARLLVGRGHLVGLKLTAGGLAEAEEQLAEGAALLRRVARCRVAAVLAEGLSQSDRAALEEGGLPCWETTTDARDRRGSAAAQSDWIIQRLSTGGNARNYLLFGEGVEPALSAILSSLRGADFRLRAPVSTAL